MRWPWQPLTVQEKWDQQIERDRSADWRSAHMIASKMKKCRHNPRNGGAGEGDGCQSPYYVDDADPRREKADNRRWGMR